MVTSSSDSKNARAAFSDDHLEMWTIRRSLSAARSSWYDNSPAWVPEPVSWALILGGFGLVGGAMRSRKFAVSFA